MAHATTGKGCGGAVEQRDEEVSDSGRGPLICNSLIVCCKEVTYSVVGRGKAYITYLEGREVKVLRQTSSF